MIANAREHRVLLVENRLLAALPWNDRQHFLSGCEQIELVLGNVLCEPGEVMQYVYFPTDSVLSLMTPIDGHNGLEVAMVGSEGMFGVPLLLGVDATLLHAVVQGSGLVWRMDAARFHKELMYSTVLYQHLSRYVYVLMTQLAQTAVCTRFHVVEERLARWLLMTRDRAHSEAFHLTHEFLAHMLGVRRVGITKAAGSLQHKKLISYSRGDVVIHDVGGLEAASCPCYLTDKETYGRILHC